MADVPKDLLQEIKRLEELFSVDKAKLKGITDHFVKELEKGKSYFDLGDKNSFILTMM
jgi:hexokinase